VSLALEEQRDDETVARRPTRRRLLEWGLLALPVIVLAVLAWVNRWMTDDGWINLRVVQEVLHGHGPVFNPGQRVEAFTSPAWLGVLVVADVLTPFKLEWIAVVLGIVAALSGLGLSIAGASMLVRRSAPGALLLPVGALVPLALPPVWRFASSGLETGLVFAWQGATLWLLAQWARDGGRPRPLALVVIGLGWLIRPELALMSVAFVVAVLAERWRDDRWRDRVGTLVVTFALPAMYEVFRMGYYALVVPNTALAKEASSARWGRGWSYLTDFVGPYRLWFPLVVLALFAYAPLVVGMVRAHDRRGLFVTGAFVAAALLDALYIVRVGGDYFPARLLLPALFALCAPVMVVPFGRLFAISLLVAPWVLVCALAFRAPGLPPFGTRTAFTVADTGWGKGGVDRAWYRGPGVYFNSTRLPFPPPPGLHLPTDAQWGIGVSSYALGARFQVLDLLGLADPFTAHLQLVHRGFPGHEKPLPAPWSAARLTAPGAAVTAAEFPPPPLVAPMIPVTTGVAFAEQVAWARAALACPALQRLERSYTAPLTAGRFFSNLWHAATNTRIRIPADPEQAYRKFCGPGFPPGTRAAVSR
jgi:arabinofuranosyltransferase